MRPVETVIKESIDAKEAMLCDAALLERVTQCGEAMTASYRAGGKSLFCGNGGSAADAQHFAAELSGRFLIERDPLPAEALHGNTSYLTAVGNDYDYDQVFARAVRGTGRAGDVLVALSTSGRSRNVVLAAQAAQEVGMTVLSFTGEDGRDLKEASTICVEVPTSVTGRIQEAHITLIHAISEQVEAALFAPDGDRGTW